MRQPAGNPVLQHGDYALESAMSPRLDPGAALSRIVRRQTVGQEPALNLFQGYEVGEVCNPPVRAIVVRRAAGDELGRYDGIRGIPKGRFNISAATAMRIGAGCPMRRQCR